MAFLEDIILEVGVYECEANPLALLLVGWDCDEKRKTKNTAELPHIWELQAIFNDPQMKANFILYQNYAIHFDNKHLDLHNNFDFEEFFYNIEKRQLTLHWKGVKADWVPADNPSKLIITIYEVGFLKIVPRDNEMPFSEDTCLNDLTYYSSSEREEDECVYGQEKPT